MRQVSVYLPGLNGLRAIAALSVLIAHVSQEGIADFGLPKLVNLPMAGYGVTLFFVISGFLITFLLIKEMGKTQTVSIGKFYLRRILRIWPIYYLFIIVSLSVFLCFGLSNQILVKELWFYLFFAANIPFITYQGIMILVHYWSIGVEEQFYLFWPLLVRISKSKLLKVALIIFILFFSAKILFWVLYGPSSIIYRFFMVTRFHCMMIGAIAAILYSSKNEIFMRFSTNKFTQGFAWLMFVLMGFGVINVPAVIGQEVMAFASVSMIMGQIVSGKKIFNLETRLFDFTGKISYGIYIVHPLVIFLLSYCFKYIDVNMIAKYFLVYSSAVIFTILIAWLSYRYYETPFLKLKRRFMIVKSSNSMYSESR